MQLLLMGLSELAHLLHARYHTPFTTQLVLLFDLGRERSIPAWYTSVLMAAAAGLLLFIAAWARRRERQSFPGWLVLTAGVLLLSVDEMLALHEPVTDRFQEGVQALAGQRGVWGAAAVAGGLVLTWVLRLLLTLPARVWVLLALSAALFVGGAVGVEWYEGVAHRLYGGTSLPFRVAVLVEEPMELAGMSFFLYTLWVVVGVKVGRVEIRLRRETTTGSRPLASLTDDLSGPESPATPG
jgi:hypothetical protein